MSGKTLLLFSFLFLFGRALSPAQEDEPSGNPEHEREELGINQYTAPSIARIFNQLDQLKPLPFEKVKRALPKTVAASREQKGLIFGGLIADGFLIVAAERTSLVEEFGRVLLREARGLGVGDRVTRHSASLTQMGKRGHWPAVRKELINTQADVEQALMELRDEKMAHLISLGGWLRGLEISASAVTEQFSPERARILAEPDLTTYFLNELKTLPPNVIHTPLFEKIRTAVDTIDSILKKPTLHPAEVRDVATQARLVNDAIRQTE